MVANEACEPCPSCWGRNLHVAEWYNPDGEASYRMVCDDCGYEDPDLFEEEYVCIDHWNRRVVTGYIEGEDPTDTMYDKLEEDDLPVDTVVDEEVSAISWELPPDAASKRNRAMRAGTPPETFRRKRKKKKD